MLVSQYELQLDVHTIGAVFTHGTNRLNIFGIIDTIDNATINDISWVNFKEGKLGCPVISAIAKKSTGGG